MKKLRPPLILIILIMAAMFICPICHAKLIPLASYKYDNYYIDTDTIRQDDGNIISVDIVATREDIVKYNKISFYYNCDKGIMCRVRENSSGISFDRIIKKDDIIITRYTIIRYAGLTLYRYLYGKEFNLR